MDILTDSHHVTRLDVVDTGRRRRWSDEAKVRIVEESFSAPRLGSATARRHGISNQQIFAWRKAYREGRLGADGLDDFVPARIVEEAGHRGSGGGRSEIVSANGRRLIVEGDVDVAALLRIVQGLETLR